MNPAWLAWKSLTREPARAALGVAGITAIGALLFDMLMLSRGIVVSFADILRDTGFDVRVTATEALPMMGPRIRHTTATAAELARLPEVAEIVPLREASASALDPRGRPHELMLLGSTPQDRRAWTLLRGEGFRAGTAEMVVNRNLASDLGAEPGTTLRIRARADGVATAAPAKLFRVTGIADFPFDVTGSYTAVTALGAFDGVVAEGSADEADMLLVVSREAAGPEAAVAAIRRARPDLWPFSIDQMVARLSLRDFSYFRQVSFALSTLTLFFAFLLVATILTVSVNQRLGEVAALRALGFARRRIAAGLLAESAMLVGAGGLLALPAGALLARLLDGILRSMPGIPERIHFFVVEPRAVALHGALLAVAALSAAVYPTLVVTRLEIAATLRKEVS